MAKNEEHISNSNSNTQEFIHDEEFNNSNFLAVQQQLVKVTKENCELVQEVVQLKKSDQENKAEIGWLKRMVLQLQNGQQNHALAAAGTGTGLYGQEADTCCNKILGQKPEKTNFAKLPKVIESVSEITTFSPTSCYKAIGFSFDPEQKDCQLYLAFRYANTYYLETVSLYYNYTDTGAENKSAIDPCDYFIQIRAVKDSKPTENQLWIKVSTRNKMIESNYSTSTMTTTMDSAVLQISFNGVNSYSFWKDTSNQLEIIASISLFFYDATTATIDSYSSPSSRLTSFDGTRTAKLLDFESQTNSTTVSIYTSNYSSHGSPISKKTLLDSGSSILDNDLKSTSSKYQNGIPCNMTSRSVDAFCNWVYGMDTGAFVDDIQLNMEVLHFAHKFWICDLIKFCIDNICQTLDKNFTYQLFVKVKKFEEAYKIRDLHECLREVIKTKAKMNFDIEGCLPWKK